MNQVYRAGGVTYRPATHEDDEQLRKLLRDNAMDGWVKMSLEREPSYFAGHNLMGKTETIIAHKDNDTLDTIGMYSCSFMKQHINGYTQEVGYLAGLRVNPLYRNKLRIVRQGYKSIHPLITHSDNPPIWVTSIAKENRRARRLLEAGLKGMPHYKHIGELDTLAFSSRLGRSYGLLQQATADDIPTLVAFYNRNVAKYQFSPVLEEQWLQQLDGKHGLQLSDFYLFKENQTIIGCIALWDQRAFKQVIAQAYRFPANLLRSPYNAWAKLTRRITLPKSGHDLASIYLAFAVFPNDSKQAICMLKEALYHAQSKRASAAVLSLSPQHPLHEAFTNKFIPMRYTTCIENVVLTGEPHHPINNTPVQPEAALL